MKRYTTDTIIRYLNDLSSKKATPGGGSVACLTAAMGVGLICMVAKFSDKEKKAADVIKKVTPLIKELTKLVDKDVIAYNKVKAAYDMPKRTELQKQKRKKKIKEALRGALGAPCELLDLSLKGLVYAKELVQVGNKALISDTAMSAILLQAAYQSAVYNIKINLRDINDKNLSKRIYKKIERVTKRINSFSSEILKEIDKVL